MADAAADRAILSEDTTREMERRQIEIWRSLSSVEIAALINSTSRAARDLALAGLRERYPHASERELFLRLAALTLGRELAERVYPELRDLRP